MPQMCSLDCFWGHTWPVVLFAELRLVRIIKVWSQLIGAAAVARSGPKISIRGYFASTNETAHISLCVFVIIGQNSPSKL